MTTIPSLTAAGTATGDEAMEVAQLSTSVTITAATISAAAADNSYNDSGSGFVSAGFSVGDEVKVTGFTGDTANNIYKGTITALSAGKMTIGGTDGDVIVDDAAGESVTITKWISRRMTSQQVADLGGAGSFNGALVYRATTAFTVPINTMTAIEWNAEDYDTASWHDNATNPSRLTVPSGVSRVRASCNINFSVNASRVLWQLWKNGAGFNGAFRSDMNVQPIGGTPYVSATSAVINVTPGDYFQVAVFSNAANTVGASAWSWFAIEAV